MNTFTQPQHYSFEKYKEHSILLPLDSNLQVTSFQELSGNQWKEKFFDTLLKSAVANTPKKSKTRHLKDIDKAFSNLMKIIKLNLNNSNPLVPMAYPVANCWIIVFYSDFFNKSKGLNVPPEVQEVDYDPIHYAYKLTF